MFFMKKYNSLFICASCINFRKIFFSKFAKPLVQHLLATPMLTLNSNIIE